MKNPDEYGYAHEMREDELQERIEELEAELENCKKNRGYMPREYTDSSLQTELAAARQRGAALDLQLNESQRRCRVYERLNRDRLKELDALDAELAAARKAAAAWKQAAKRARDMAAFLCPGVFSRMSIYNANLRIGRGRRKAAQP